MSAKHTTRTLGLASIAMAVLTAGCGQYLKDQGRSPAKPVIVFLDGSSGNRTTFGNPIISSVLTNVTTPAPCTPTSPCPTSFNDLGRVQMAVVLKDQGAPGAATAPSSLNQITFTRYRVVYRRSDGRNTPGVDVPYPFDAGLTFTVTPGANTTTAFEIVRSTAKVEAPLQALRTSSEVINSITEVTFYGRDLAGNDVSITGSVNIDFGYFPNN